MIVIDYCPIRSIQLFSFTCRDARRLLVVERGGYAHRVLARRGPLAIVRARSMAALNLPSMREHWQEIEQMLQQQPEHWPEALALLQQRRALASLQQHSTQD